MKSIIVNVMPEETRIAVKENNRLTSLELERPRHSHLVGNIYKGIVQNVLPGMQAAFVDIGQSKNAFLYIGDGKAEVDGVGSPRKTIHIGQVLPVQITKDEVGTKGPRATMHLTIPGRNVVLMPRSAYIGTSHRIDSEQERRRLYDIVREACPEDMGVIIRTAAMGQSKECIQRDIRYLIKVWQSVEAKSKLMKGTGLLYRDVDLVIRIVRDLFNEDVEQMVIDDEIVYGRVKDLLQGMAPEWADRLKLYKGSNIFEYYEIEAEAVSAGNRQIPLDSGGFLVIDKTEAMTVIDVNTGSFVGNVNLGETAFALNKEAAVEIMHQLRLRDIGGIVLVDFIDMEKEEHNKALLQLLRQLAQQDRTKTHVVDITALGLVEITRKKTRHNIDNLLYRDCPVCQGSGRILSAEALAINVCREIRRIEAHKHGAEGYTLHIHPEAAKELKTGEAFEGLYKDLGVRVNICSDREIQPGCYSLFQK